MDITYGEVVGYMMIVTNTNNIVEYMALPRAMMMKQTTNVTTKKDKERWPIHMGRQGGRVVMTNVMRQ